jgi:release factor glutamine methyltransferase
MPSSDARSLSPAPATGAEAGAALHAELAGTLRRAGCVFAEDEARLILGTARTPAEAAAMAARRAAGLPLEHVLGWAEFRGLRITLDPGVFVPRRRTEFLVEHAVPLARPGTPVVDLCCGSGALGAALAAAVPGVELHAADLDPAAVRCARRNLAAYGGHVHHGDLFAALPGTLRGRIAVLLANVPYVPSGEIPLLPAEARDHESPAALDGGPDGLDVLRRVAAEAPGWLAPGGTLLVEAGERQARRAAGVLTSAGLRARIVRDENRAATVVTGTKAR